jgi:hypothetical protein
MLSTFDVKYSSTAARHQQIYFTIEVIHLLVIELAEFLGIERRTHNDELQRIEG